MAAKKMGRPTDSPKDIDIKIRFDKDTVDKLEICSEKMQITRAEVVRRGVKKMYDDLNKKWKEAAHFSQKTHATSPADYCQKARAT